MHTHVDRRSIATAGLALIDRRGLEALTLRNLAHELGAGAATLYAHVGSKDEIVRDIVALLLAEIEASPRPGEGWSDWLRRGAFSTREMALRHPRAFPLYATTPDDEPPMLDFARRYLQASRAYGVAEGPALTALQVLGGYLTGFLLQEAAEKVRALADPAAHAAHAAKASSGDPVRGRLAHVHSAEAFATGLEAVLAGLRQLPGMPV